MLAVGDIRLANEMALASETVTPWASRARHNPRRSGDGVGGEIALQSDPEPRFAHRAERGRSGQPLSWRIGLLNPRAVSTLFF
jgi:hypothetical protein